MKILTDDQIKEAINRCKPRNIAVAYIGAEWSSFIIDYSSLDSIIVSPTLGSNPRAIIDVAKKIGWDKVHLLIELHAKMYIGNSTAIIGSANLTSNGLCGKKLFELCAEVVEKETIDELNSVFSALLERAKKQYPTPESKNDRINALEMIWSATISNRLAREEHSDAPDFMDFEHLGESHFYVIWYQPDEFEHSEDVKSIEKKIADSINLSSADIIEKNKWVLTWRITNSGAPHKSEKLKWLYVHDVLQNGTADKNSRCPQCAIQRNDLDLPPPPFKISSEVTEAFKHCIQEDKNIAKHLVQNERDVYSLGYSIKAIPRLMTEMKDYIQNKINRPHSKI